MAQKEDISNDLKDLKVKLQQQKVVIGADRVLKALRKNAVTKVFLSSNCPVKTKGDVMHYAALAGVPVLQLELDNEELGLFCKKNFLIAVLGTEE